ncbi:MAG: histidinol-phosphate transaminase [Dehalococcoidia bacterium]|nr:MAG: histidinol-phosphate transaminase [Dehalococcoidia bacterium]
MGAVRRFDPQEALRPALRSIPAYAALEDLDAVARQYGVDPATVVKVDGNENPYGPSPKALEALRGDYQPHRYGDAGQRRLRAAISRYLDVPAESVVCGSGSDEIIDLLFRLFIGEGDRIVTASPTFGMYAFDAALHGGEVVDVPLLEGWAFDFEGLEAAARESKAVFIPSPNNPTGNTVPVALVERLLGTGALVVLDEAYIEFSHTLSLARRAATEPGLVVLRTLSKWGGLAGLRFGYGVMHPQVADLLMRTKQPYNINAAAEAAALASFEDTAILDERARTLATERERISAALAGLGWLHPYPSEAVFVLLRLGREGQRIEGKAVRDSLRKRGIFPRFFDTPRLRDHIRISIGTPEQNDRVIAAFREIGEEQARG